MSREKVSVSDPGLQKASLSLSDFKTELLNDYKLACVSRETSILGRKEVLTGKAKFGIFGDGKEIPQLALAKVFRNGDFRAGYYRDQTFALAIGIVTVEQLLGQLYAHPSLEADPHSAGRQMNNHFATRNINADGSWKTLKSQKNTAADNSPTASQMPRSLGLALASKKYRDLWEERGENIFSDQGNEVCFATIGDASTSEGHFWEVVNAAGVQRVPLAISIWDDGYGISVPKELQTTKGSVSEILEGFRVDDKGRGFDLYRAKGWDYPSLVKMYKMGIEKVRRTHIPAIFHIEELTQPQGHSTSGSHERYKSEERLEWERDFDCIRKMREWLLSIRIATAEELDAIQLASKKEVYAVKKTAWNSFQAEIKEEIDEVVQIMQAIAPKSKRKNRLLTIAGELKATLDPVRKDVFNAVNEALRIGQFDSLAADGPDYRPLIKWRREHKLINSERYNSYLFTDTMKSALKVPVVPAEYAEKPKILSGFRLLNACFDANLERDHAILAFGEDVGRIGDVNQAFAGLQEKYGEARVYDTGIREASIIGEGIGLAMRGWKPIAEIQYLDYLLYGLQPMADDLATLSYRTKGGQKAPLIVRTRGHRLEGIWHTGSPIGMLLGSLRGMHICVPRNMTQAAGFYNTLLRSDEPALVIECLNGYRLKERIPTNPGEFTVPLGIPEVLVEGSDLTLVTYGSCVRIAQEAVEQLQEVDISVELIDVQTLLPFDLHHKIGASVRKTNRIIFLDEDVPGGGTAYMMQQSMEEQEIFRYLDAPPGTLSAHAHRSAFGTDGDYFSKPNTQDVFEAVYEIMHETNPAAYPRFY
jgi:pyruvate/2-oxoglutarate/acetoin dehydrogenase E1 component/TPP-dependent pyruvate/acetoin dehydrogenase alpha subunit